MPHVAPLLPLVPLRAGECVPDPALPINITQNQPQDQLCKGFLNVMLPPYSAAGDGITDDSTAIQFCVNDAYRYRMVRYSNAARDSTGA